MIYYKIHIKETSSNEGMTFGCNTLNLESWKAIKKELIDTANRSGWEHELTLTKITDNNHASNGHFLGSGIKEKILTKIKYGASVWELERKQIWNLF